MRDNGLQAASWTSIAEVDPRVADALLEMFADAGVAAYAVPSQGRVGGYLDVTYHSSPTDQVFVDSDSVQRAYEIVLAHQNQLRADFGSGSGAAQDATAPARTDDRVYEGADPSPSRLDPAPEPNAQPPVEDQVWEDLVSRIESSPSLPDRAEQATAAPADAGTASEWSDVEETVQQREEMPKHPELEDDPDDHFVPPDPGPLPESDQISRWAWAGVIGGPAFLVVMTALGWNLEGWLIAAAIGAFLLGFATLVFRMGDRPHVDDDPDGGAVV